MSNGMCVGLVLLCGCAAAGAAEPAPVVLTPGHKQLFLDNAIIAQMHDLTRMMHQPTKRGAVITPTLPSDGTWIQIRSAPMWIPDEHVWKLVYFTNSWPTGVALATSKDGVHWDKPDLDRVMNHGSKHNNQISIAPDLAMPGGREELDNVLYDANDPNPATRYKGLYGATYRLPAYSANCLDWKVLRTPKIQSGDESQLNYDPQHHLYLASVKGFNKYGRAVALATSKDFTHWTPAKIIFSADEEDQRMARTFIRQRLANKNLWRPAEVAPEPPADSTVRGANALWTCDVYNMAIFPYQGIYIGLPAFFYHTGLDHARTNCDGFHLIQLVMSRDLEHWKRLGHRQPFIGPSPINHGLLGVFDRTQLLPPTHPIVHGDELWFYYTGMKWRDSSYEFDNNAQPRSPADLTPLQKKDEAEGWGAVCLATLRLDGFISLDAGTPGGWLQTVPMRAEGKALYLNVAAAHGQVLVAVQTPTGQTLPGFALSDCQPMTGDSVHMQVQWQGGASWQALAGKTVRLVVHLRRGQLYALWTE